jgi:ABC-type nitrate/sulfonate/bicarbonate transport system ATPase subunit
MSVVEATRRGEVTIRDLSKTFALNGQRVPVLRALSLKVQGGESLAIVGPSGCRKTTLLRIIAGLEQPEAGQVLIDGNPVADVGTERAIIFQEPRLLPWLTVLGNVAFGLQVRGVAPPEAERRAPLHPAGRPRRVRDHLSPPTFGRHGAACRHRPRADGAAGNPAAGRTPWRAGRDDQADDAGELARIWREEKVTLILVTHDLEEAIYLADRVLVLPKEKGAVPRLIDVDLPRPRGRSEPQFVEMRKRLMAEFGLH